MNAYSDSRYFTKIFILKKVVEKAMVNEALAVLQPYCESDMWLLKKVQNNYK